MLKLRAPTDVTRFELQSLLYKELLDCGLSLRGGVKVVCPTGGALSVDVVVMKRDVIQHVIMVSSSADVSSLRTRDKRDRRYDRTAAKLSSLGVPVSVIRTLKQASDFVSFVRKMDALPLPTYQAVTKTSGSTSPPSKNQLNTLKQLAATRRHPFTPAELKAMSSRDVRNHIRSLQQKKPVKHGPCSQEMNLADVDNPEWTKRNL